VAANVLELAAAAAMLGAIRSCFRGIASGARVTIDDAATAPIAVHKDGAGVEVRVSPRRVAWAMALGIAGLAVGSSLSVWAYDRIPGAHYAHRFLYVDFEGNLPTWWSSMTLLACAGVAAFLASMDRTAFGGVARTRRQDWGWLALFLLALAADEAASLHELMQRPLRSLLHSEHWLRYPLIVPGVIVSGLVVLRFRRFARTLGATRRRLAIGALVFAFGAFGVEAIGGRFAPEVFGRNTTYEVLTLLEETTEMVGSTMVLIALLRHIAVEPRAGDG
jgi:hypothetical protein